MRFVLAIPLVCLAACTPERVGPAQGHAPAAPVEGSAAWDGAVAWDAIAHVEGRALPEPVGGRWVSCYGHFSPAGAPARDVAWLGELCGPANGMALAQPTFSGRATPAAVSLPFDAEAGDCFRVFAVGGPAVRVLDVEVANAKGAVLYASRHGDRWPVVNPEGPFCLFDGGTYTVRVRARVGEGDFALQLWKLR